MIINELVTNSIKYGFPESKQGEILIKLTTENEKNCICIQDSGIGLPEDLQIKTSGTFGFQMVNALVAQLDGNINIESGHGTKISITFP